MMSKFRNKLSDEDVRGRRIIVSKEAQISKRIKPHISSLLAGSYYISGRELERLAQKADNGGLSRDEIKTYTALTEAVARLAREEREQEKRLNPQDLTNEQLSELAAQALHLLQPAGEVPEDIEADSDPAGEEEDA